jgi:hypothetical protein
MPYFMERVRARANFKGFVYRVPALFAANLALAANLKMEMKIILCGHDRKMCGG